MEELPKEYPRDNPYKTGDEVKWDGKVYTVGDDFEEIARWAGGHDKFSTHIVTTCGRVLPTSYVEPVYPTRSFSEDDLRWAYNQNLKADLPTLENFLSILYKDSW